MLISKPNLPFAGTVFYSSFRFKFASNPLHPHRKFAWDPNSQKFSNPQKIQLLIFTIQKSYFWPLVDKKKSKILANFENFSETMNLYYWMLPEFYQNTCFVDISLIAPFGKLYARPNLAACNLLLSSKFTGDHPGNKNGDHKFSTFRVGFPVMTTTLCLLSQRQY